MQTQQGHCSVARRRCCGMFRCLDSSPVNMKINGQALLLLIVIVFIVKACGGDDAPRTGKVSRVGMAEVSTPAQPARHAYTPAMAPEPSSSVSAPAAPKIEIRYVGPKSLNVRSTPNGPVTGALKHGTPVDIHHEEGGWSRISVNSQPARWVSSAHLCKQRDCSDIPKWKPAPVAPPVSAPVRRAAPPASSSYGCPCSSSNNCYGPRGGRYCITSGGNKRYR